MPYSLLPEIRLSRIVLPVEYAFPAEPSMPMPSAKLRIAAVPAALVPI